MKKYTTPSSASRIGLRNDILENAEIIIIDDNELESLTLKSFLSKAGFKKVKILNCGIMAIEEISERPPDIVFLDIVMHNINGIDVCKNIRSIHNGSDMIIIMQTGLELSQLKARSFDAGADDYITKPIFYEEVIARTISHLEKQFLNRRNLMDYQRIQQELQEAVVLQNILLPEESTIESIKNSSSIDISHYYHPASELGGDYISVRRLSDSKIAIISSDVSGHGITGALYSFAIHTLLSDDNLLNKQPAEVLFELNNKLHSMMVTGKFATIFVGVIDCDNLEMTYSAAANPQPFIISEGKTRLLETRAIPLGVKKDNTYQNKKYHFQKNDLMFLYSDALLETVDSNGLNFDEADITSLLCESSDKDSGGVLRKIMEKFNTRFGSNLIDDLTLLVCKF